MKTLSVIGYWSIIIDGYGGKKWNGKDFKSRSK